MKNINIYAWILMVVNIARLYKLYNNTTHVSLYGVYNSTTLIIYIAMVSYIIFTNKDKQLRVAAMLLILSIILEYVPVFTLYNNYAFIVVSMLAVLASIGVLMKLLITKTASEGKL